MNFKKFQQLVSERDDEKSIRKPKYPRSRKGDMWQRSNQKIVKVQLWEDHPQSNSK